MKKIVSFIILMCLLVPLNSQAQEDILQRTGTLDIKDLRFSDALNVISKKYNVNFFYNSGLFGEEEKVSLSGTFTFEEVLKTIINPRKIGYKIRKEKVIFFDNSAMRRVDNDERYVLSGYVTDSTTGEALTGATIVSTLTGKGGISNDYGFYSLYLPAGEKNVQVSYLGYNRQVMEIDLSDNKRIDFKLTPGTFRLKEAEVVAEKWNGKEEVRSTQMSKIELDIKQIENVPVLFGESDPIKVIQLMPGVKKGVEGQTGMFVRGGHTDQNLILLDEAVVYNVSHLLGFFSVFNNDALKDVTMIKGGFPANYGGRLSSIMDVRMKEGNLNKFSAKGGIGLISSRLTLEGPIIKDRMSFLISGRRTYIDKVFKTVNIDLPYYFYDLNGKINYKISERDRIYLSAYHGNDIIKAPAPLEQDSSDYGLSTNFTGKVGNLTNTLRWNRIINEKLFSNLCLVHTNFNYKVAADIGIDSIYIASRIRDFGIKYDLNNYVNPDLTLKFGGAFTTHFFRPNIINTNFDITGLPGSKHGKIINTQEGGIYLNAEYKYNKNLVLNGGLRLSGLLGKEVFYGGPEPRFSASYSFNDRHSVKGSYSRMYQYLHLVSNSSVSLPTDLWYPVTKKIRPQNSDQVALGYALSFPKLKTMFTAETYYKWMRNMVEYKEGAVLILNDKYEKELLKGKGNAYGFEFLLHKKAGRFNGWIGYTISWSTREFDSLNQGKVYYAKFDRRHDLSLVFNVDITGRLSFSSSWIYATGSRITALIGQYAMPSPGRDDVELYPIYSDRNEVVLSPSHRLDVNLVIKNKPSKKFRSEWHIGAYNFYNRAQSYRVDLDYTTGNYKETGLFGFIPSVAWNFNF